MVVATDHADIAAIVTEAGYHAHMTLAEHPSGTDRIAQVAMERTADPDDTIVVNVQGNEAATAPQLIESVAQALNDDTSCVMATAAHPAARDNDFLNPNNGESRAG